MTQSVVTNGKIGQHAIVMGGSLSGLLAARILTDHFERVTLIERDRISAETGPRKGVGQSRQTHGLLGKGQQIMSELFPGLFEELVAGGAIQGDMARILRWHHFGGYKVDFDSGLIGVAMSRPFLEYHIRQRVLAIPNLTLIEDCDLTGLVATDLNARIGGVQIQRRAPGAIGELLSAELVVDATGRGSQSPKWLEALDYPRVAETTIKVDIGYATRLYRRDPNEPGSHSLYMAFPTPPHEKRMGVMFPIEGDRWSLSVGGWAGDHAPLDEQGFLEFARSLPASDIYNIIKRAEPLSDIVPYKFPANLRRRYEKMARFPEGYIVLGDALCSFNPVYGQGMTTAALDAVTLDECLKQQVKRGTLVGLPRRFFKQAAKVIDIPWTLAAGEDFRYPETQGPKAPGTDFINRYVARVHLAAQVDPMVYYSFLQVMNLIAPPTTLFNPKIVLRVLQDSRWLEQHQPALRMGEAY